MSNPSARNRHADWTNRAKTFVDILNRFLAGSLSPNEYRSAVRNPSLMDMGPSPEMDPVYSILVQLVHDANEYVPTAELRESDDMNLDMLRIRAGFGRDAIAVSIAYVEHSKAGG
jgi:hypothetical protein